MTNGRRGFATHDTPSRDSLAERKRQLRKIAKAQRRRAHAQSGATAGGLLRDRLLSEVTIPDGAVVAGFAPIDDEIDVLPLLSTLSDRGHPCALPVVVGRALPLVFRAWSPGMALTEAEFGVSVPPPSSPEVRPAVVLVPLLAFDATGQRIGYGAGFYDRTLTALRQDDDVLAIGIAYADQQVDSVPIDRNDVRLDLIVTERSVIRPRG